MSSSKQETQEAVDNSKETSEEDYEDCSDSNEDEHVDPMEELLQKMGLCLSKNKSSKEPSQNEYDSMLQLVADYMKSDKCKNVITMAGAGISTSAGIPDFRSPKTGLYATLADKYPELSQPEDIFNISFFKENPTPFLKLAKELMAPSGGDDEGFKPTPSHHFIKHLSDKGILLRHYTQNIDGLERKAGVPEKQLIEAHGSFNKAHCVSRRCGKEYTESWMRDMIMKDVVPTCSDCKSLVKPDIVFFGENLPDRFHTSVTVDFQKCDMLIVMGTSLQVQPFASLVNMVNKDCPVLLINMENSAPWMFKQPLSQDEFHGSKRKVYWKGACDDGCTKLESFLGWQTKAEKDDASKTEKDEIKTNTIKEGSNTASLQAMGDQEPKPGSSKESDEAKNTPKDDPKNMKLSEYLALPENKGANLVQPLQWCPHLETITTETLPSNFDVQKAACEECGHVGENWICLICLSIHCSRYVNEHMLIHGAEKEHPLTLSFSDISVWCYTCNDYIDNAKLYNFKNVVHKSKFGEDIPRTTGNEVLELQIQ